jgi:hypothetical protein
VGRGKNKFLFYNRMGEKKFDLFFDVVYLFKLRLGGSLGGNSFFVLGSEETGIGEGNAEDEADSDVFHF